MAITGVRWSFWIGDVHHLKARAETTTMAIAWPPWWTGAMAIVALALVASRVEVSRSGRGPRRRGGRFRGR